MSSSTLVETEAPAELQTPQSGLFLCSPDSDELDLDAAEDAAEDAAGCLGERQARSRGIGQPMMADDAAGQPLSGRQAAVRGCATARCLTGDGRRPPGF